MELKEKERTLIQDLQTQEQSCVEKYGKYAAQAKDPELKSLFETIQKEEQKHYDTLQQVLDGSVPACDCNDTQGKDYEPKVTYGTLDNSEDKKHDAFLATDCIGTEKLVSGEYNTDVFAFAIIAPEEKGQEKYLVFLSRLARKLVDEKFIADFRNCRSTEAVYQYVKNELE